uniref:Uncharacterized protein n=1 Tax=Ascaris lumbricoides TaxID=6252 RepID=A0A0M3I8T8_ASCLU
MCSGLQEAGSSCAAIADMTRPLGRPNRQVALLASYYLPLDLCSVPAVSFVVLRSNKSMATLSIPAYTVPGRVSKGSSRQILGGRRIDCQGSSALNCRP